MKLYWILFAAILLIGISVPCEGRFNATRLQKFINDHVDVAKFKEKGIKSFNETALNSIWSFFKLEFQRRYTTSEDEKQRIQIFHEHLKRVIQSNLEKKRSYKLAMNEFSDMTLEEFNSFKKGFKITTSSRRHMTDYQDNNEKSVRNHLSEFYQDYYHARRSKRNIHRRQDEDDDSSDSDGNDNYNKRSPTEFDWRTKNVVSSIKDQGQCGSCYAFATSAVMESAHAIKTRSGNVIDFSPQEIVDCSSNGNYGCDGGDFGPTVNYLSGQKGEIATLASYPYVATQETCQTSNIKRIDLGHIKYGQVTQGDETKLAEAVVNNGPLYIALYANTQDFMFYESGVLSISNCPNSVQDLDHALALVGYGYDNELQKAYWIIKNSWGTSWGEDGYLRLARDAGNMCGVSSWAFYANLN